MASYLVEFLRAYYKGINKRNVAHDIKNHPQPIPQPTINVGDVYTTRTVARSDETISGFYELARAGGNGTINQILCMTDSNDYTIRIYLDNYILFDKPFSYFSDNSSILENISGYTDAGSYYLSIRGVSFLEKFIINVVANTSITFNEILVKYTIRNEHYI